MLDIGLSELMLIGGVALVVLGPEKLAVVARTTGKWLGKAQGYVNDVKADIAREGELAELRKLKSELESAGQEIEQSMRQTSQTLQADFQAIDGQVRDDVSHGLTEAQSHEAIQASLDSTSQYVPPNLNQYLPPAVDMTGNLVAPALNDPIALRMELDVLNDEIVHIELKLQDMKTRVAQMQPIISSDQQTTQAKTV